MQHIVRALWVTNNIAGILIQAMTCLPGDVQQREYVRLARHALQKALTELDKA